VLSLSLEVKRDVTLDRKMLFIDLSTRDAWIEPVPSELREKFLGGRGINMAILSRSYAPDLDPLSPANPLIFGAGLLTGTLGFGSRTNITSKSPESGHLGDSNMGGQFGAELVKAGFSHLVVTGKSPTPAYILIRNDQVEIRDAEHLWGSDTLDTQRRIRSEVGDEKVQTACIGAAGENLVKFACIRTGMKNAAGRTGMGAVMGSKNLKAVAVRGSLDIPISNPKAYLRYYFSQLKKLMGTKWIIALSKYGTPLLFKNSNLMGFLSYKNNQFTSAGELAKGLYADVLETYSTGMVACFGCPVHCRHRIAITNGKYQGTVEEGPEYASMGSMGTKLGNLDIENVLYAVELCNRFGLDTISTGTYIAWAMELYQRGIIGTDLTGMPLEWGNGDTIVELLHQIAHRRGFGNLIVEGPGARDVYGKASEDYLLEIKNFPVEMTDERLPKSFALGMATSSRGACHMRSRASIDVLGLPEEVLKKVYGGPVNNQLSSYSGKARMVWWHEIFNAVTDALGICRFQSVFSSPHGLQYPEYSRLIKYVTGLSITPGELKRIGERIYTLERMMLVRDGMSRRDDTLPKRYFDEPIPEGPAKGEVISREKFQGMLDEYYRLHGWDENGVPKEDKLERLGLIHEN
jgi:aldehyde:ferredoxin oxidoreductase